MKIGILLYMAIDKVVIFCTMMKNVHPMDTHHPTPAQAFNESLRQARMRMLFYLSELVKLKANGSTRENDHHYRDVADDFRGARKLYLSMFHSRYVSCLTVEQKVLIDHVSQATSSLKDLRGGEIFNSTV